MPILAPEPASYPLELLTEPLPQRTVADESPRQWSVLCTKSRNEKALARELFDAGISYYLPLTFHETVVRGKVHHVSVPVWTGYMFLYGDAVENAWAVRSRRVAHVLHVPDQERLESELRNLHTLIASGIPLTIENQLAPGRRVRVKQGALMGLEGIVVQRRGGSRLIVAVTYLQQGVSVEISDSLVEPISC